MKRPESLPIKSAEVPGFNSWWACQKGVQNNFLLETWGGIGDQICAEPTLRWATLGGGLKGGRVTLASPYPELFAHLPFDDVYNTKHERPIYDDYFLFRMMVDTNSLTYQFMSHMIIQCVDYPALCSFRQTLYTQDKNIIMKPPTPSKERLLELAEDPQRYVAVHPGKHWDTKTYPAWWWNRVLASIKAQGYIPVLIGAAKTEHGGGYVEVETEGCVNLFDQTTISESIWLLQRLPILICSDSSPLHMAVSGNAFIGCVTTAKHSEYVFHWRKNLQGVNEWRWRQQNFELGGMWELVSNVPNKEEDVVIDKCDAEQILKWLPEPEVFGPWCKEKMDEYFRKV